MVRRIALLGLCSTFCSLGARGEPLSVPPESPRWDLQGNAKLAEAQGRKCLLLDGGAALLKDFQVRDGIVDADVFTSAPRGFFGIQFRLVREGADGEWVYLRQHKTGLPDALQYTPLLNTGLNWQLYNGPGFTGAVDIPSGQWFHLRLEVRGAQGKLFVKDMATPALVMDDLKSGVQKGELALHVLTGATCYAGFQFTELPDAPWERHLPPMAPTALTRWSISPAYDALSRDVERPLATSEVASIRWQEVEAEPPGLVALYRYREAPHLRVSFANDFSKRLESQPGTQLLYARTVLISDRARTRRLLIGYSDEVSVFLNGKILWRGRSAQYFRDPGFLGIVNPENDAVYLPLRKGKNELVLALSEIGGGWGFSCRLEDLRPPEHARR